MSKTHIASVYFFNKFLLLPHSCVLTLNKRLLKLALCQSSKTVEIIRQDLSPNPNPKDSLSFSTQKRHALPKNLNSPQGSPFLHSKDHKPTPRPPLSAALMIEARPAKQWRIDTTSESHRKNILINLRESRGKEEKRNKKQTTNKSHKAEAKKERGEA
jgi:hypothetical protein